MTVTIEDLKCIPQLAKLTDTQLKRLSQVMIRRSFAPGELIFLEGDPAHGIWFTLEGRVRIIKYSDSGRVQGLCVTSKGRCFGGCPLFDGEVNPASAQAINNTTLLILNDSDKETLTQRDPELLKLLLNIFTERLSLLARLGEGLGAGNVGSRINDCLATYADSTDCVNLSHEQLAELVGTAREVVTRHLNKLEADGVVSLKTNCVVILDMEELKAVCLAQM